MAQKKQLLSQIKQAIIENNKIVLVILLLALLHSCKHTKNSVNDVTNFSNEKSLGDLTRKEVIIDSLKEKRIILYKDIPFKEVIFKDKSIQLFLKDVKIFEGGVNCRSILDVFNKEYLLISFSNYTKNKNIYGSEAFRRDRIMIVNMKTKEIRVIENEHPIRLKGMKTLLRANDFEKNFHALDSVNFNQSFVNMYNAKQELIKFNLSKVKHLPLTCSNVVN